LEIRDPPRTLPYAILSAFTQDSLPIGTEIDVDGYLATTAGSATDRDVNVSEWKIVGV
jgi:hypothetical protein